VCSMIQIGKRSGSLRGRLSRKVPLFARLIPLNSTDTPLSVSANPPTYATMLLRREFSSEIATRSAVVHLCGLGQYELTLNGRRVGDDLLTPGWTKI